MSPPKAAPAASKKRRPARPALLPVDAEDIALARLQADVRQSEEIQATTRHRQDGAGLPADLLDKARQRARRDRVPLSQVIQAALERYLRTR